MFCPNCGNNLKDGSLFCDNCGASLSETAPDANENGQQPPTIPETNENPCINSADNNVTVQAPEASESKKSFIKKWRTPKGITITAVLAVVVAAAIIFSGNIAALFKRTFYPADSYAGNVVGGNVEEAIDGLINDNKDTIDSRVEGELSLIISESIIKMMPDSETAQILSMINDLSFKFDGSSKDGDTAFLLSLCKSGDALLSGKISYDGENEMIYGELPELTKAALALKLEDLQQMMYRSSSSGQYVPSAQPTGDISMYSDAIRELTDKAASLEKSIPAILSAAIKGLGNGEKNTSENLEVGSVSETCTSIEFKLDAKAIRGAIEAAVEVIENDEAFLDYIDVLEDYLVENNLLEDRINMRSSLLDAFEELDFDELEEMLEGSLEDTDITLKFWVSRDESIAGIEVSVEDSSQKIDIFLRHAENGKDSAIEIGADENGESAALFSGESKKSGNEIDGDYTLTVRSEEILTLNVSGFDTKLSKDGYLNGVFTLTFSENLMQEILSNTPAGSMGSAASSLFSSLALRLDAESSAEASSFKLSVVGGSEDLISINLNYTKSDAEKIELPEEDDAYDATDEDDITKWAETIDLSAIERIIGELELPEEILEGILGQVDM